MFTIHQVALSPGRKLSSDEEAKEFLSDFVADDKTQFNALSKWYSNAGLLSRPEPYYTWSNGTKANFIPLSDTIAMQHLLRAEKLQDNHLARISDYINGNPVLHVGENGRIFDFPVAVDEVEAAKRTRENERLSKAWINLSKQTSIKAAHALVQRDVDTFIMLSQLKTFEALITGKWIFESMFYCYATNSSNVERCRELMESSTTYADTTYLFAIEFRL